jgi:hypothetical protein
VKIQISAVSRFCYSDDSVTCNLHLLQAYVLTLLNKLYNSLEFQYNTEDSHVMKMIQPTVTHWACTLGQKDCVTKALEMFSKWIENPENYMYVRMNTFVFVMLKVTGESLGKIIVLSKILCIGCPHCCRTKLFWKQSLP